MVIIVGHLLSQWRRSCTSRRQFGQIGSWDGCSQLRYCLREGRWPDRRLARRTSSFLFWICFGSWETLRCWYIRAKGSCVGRASRIVSLITWMELEKKQEELCLWQWWWLLWLLCRLDRYLEWQNGQGFTEWRWKMIWSWWKCELRRLEDLMKRELHIRTCCLFKRVRRLKDGCRWWMSRIMLIPWRLLPPRRSW